MIPRAIAISSFAPASISCAVFPSKPCISMSMNETARSITAGSCSMIPVAMSVKRLDPICINWSALPSNSCHNSSITIGIVSASLGTISPRFFPTLRATVAIASASSWALPDPFKKLSKAALAAFMEPSMVVDASFAVVPVMPSSPWITWIAE